MPGRYASGGKASGTTPEQIYRQVKACRQKYPNKGILHQVEASREQTWAFLMGGGALLIRYLKYPDGRDPPEYVAPEHSHVIQPTYDFIRTHLSTALIRTSPQDLVRDHPERNWCLAETGRTYLVYALKGGRFRLDLSAAGTLDAQWFNPRTGDLRDAGSGRVEGRQIVTFTAPDDNDWALYLKQKED